MSFLIFTYTIVRFRLLDINLALTRAGIFVFVYLFVLGVPFWLGYKYGLWQYAAWLMLVLATAGPFIYQYLNKKAEDIILKEQKQYQKVLRDVSVNMLLIKELERLLKTIAATVVETVKVSFAGIYLEDEKNGKHVLHYQQAREGEISLPGEFDAKSELARNLSASRIPIIGEEARASGLKIGLAVPFVVNDVMLGFMLLGSKASNTPYTQDDVLAFTILANQTALAIENCNFFKELEDRQRKARLQEMDTYSYSLAHEIDNPMHIIMGEAGLVQAEFLKEIPDEAKRKEVGESLNFIVDSARRVVGMVKAVRDFGSPISTEAKAIKVEEIIESFSQLYFPQFKANAVTFTKELPQNLGYVRGHKPELMQTLVILANNSLHAMKYAKEKKVALKAILTNHDLVRIAFTDTGYGIKKDILPIIFAPFTTTKASSEGTGMGLYNAKKIVEHHKGRIWAESEGESKGATFFIELPIVQDVRPEESGEEDKGKRIF